ncbi:MAG: hypothetical protein ACK5Z3_00255 [Pseudanabaena sp.]
MTLNQNISSRLKEEITALLMQVRNPHKVVISPKFDDVNYKYYLLPDGTYRQDKRTFGNNGKLN